VRDAFSPTANCTIHIFIFFLYQVKTIIGIQTLVGVASSWCVILFCVNESSGMNS